MNILIPMAGDGKRFLEAGYTASKPAIPTYSRIFGKSVPMVVGAAADLPGVQEGGSNITFIDRDFHKTGGVERSIQAYYPHATFLTVEALTQGQACTCLLAKHRISGREELLIAGCDNGMVYSEASFLEAKKDSDVLVFTYRNNPCVLENPNAYGWMITGENGIVMDVSIKKAISSTPEKDHAVVATFWFRHGDIFVDAAEEMIRVNDRVNGEFYVDQSILYCLQQGYKVRVFEIDRYIGWGTPIDYESYMQTYKYWNEFYMSSAYLGD